MVSRLGLQKNGEKVHLEISGPGKNHSQTLARLYPTTVLLEFLWEQSVKLRPMANKKAIDA